MKKLRISHDYVAVDEVNEKEQILNTPIYLTIHKPNYFLWYDPEEKFWVKTEVTYDGRILKCSADMVWESELEELLTECRPLHHAVLLGDSD